MRAPFQVLVLPYRYSNKDRTEYAIFKRSDAAYWQFIAGGGEDKETPIEAAKREANEEAGIPFHSEYIVLESKNTVPVEGVTGKFTWGENVFVVREYTFGVRLDDGVIVLSKEHTEFAWLCYNEAVAMLKWDSNKNALWELNARLTKQEHLHNPPLEPIVR
jgi:dihydroneopterin triphosphate diphosphatase